VKADIRRMSVTTRQRIRMTGALLMPFVFGACIGIRVEHGVRDADAYFEKAYREISRIEGADPVRSRRAHRLCLLIHDAEENQVVRLSVPIWIVDACLAAGMQALDNGHDYDAREHFDLDWKAVKDLGQYGPGLLVAVEEERDRILIWLK